MKQIDKHTLCYYCLGCNQLENSNFNGTKTCTGFYKGTRGIAKQKEIPKFKTNKGEQLKW